MKHATSYMRHLVFHCVAPARELRTRRGVGGARVRGDGMPESGRCQAVWPCVWSCVWGPVCRVWSAVRVAVEVWAVKS